MAEDLNFPTPPKGALINLETSERFDFQFNPETFTESFGVNYAKHTVPGLSWEIMNFINTKNATIPLTLYMSELLGAAAGTYGERPGEPISGRYPVSDGDAWWADAGLFPNGVLGAKAFLQSLIYPVNQPTGGWTAPPLVLFIWPKVIRMMAVVTSLSFAHQRFATKDLSTIALTADITLEECRFIQRFSASVRREGSQFQSESRG